MGLGVVNVCRFRRVPDLVKRRRQVVAFRVSCERSIGERDELMF